MGTLTTNYEIVKELGRGGMGAVYLANDKRLDRQVAIKMLQLDPTLAKDISSEIVQRFQKEAKAIAKLNHPNIVSIYDIGEENEQYFMVIELLEGQALSNLIDKNEILPLEKVLDIGIQICSALSYAHKNGIVHRDIKPANIMYSEDGTAKLTDFGIAQLGSEKQLGLTQAGSILGSILYIPPEQLIDSRKVDNKADIYSLGVSLFQLFTGKLPFEGESVAEVVTKILNSEAPSMKDYNQSIPKALDRVILKAIKKDPSLRYQDISELGKDLNDINEKLKIRKIKELAGNNIDKLDKTVIIRPKITTNLKVTTKKLDEDKVETSKKTDKNNTLILIIIVIVSLIVVIISALFLFSDNDKKEETIKDIPIQKEIEPIKTIPPLKKVEPVEKPPTKKEPIKNIPIKKEVKKIEPIKTIPPLKKVEPIKKAPVKKEPIKNIPIKKEVKKIEPIKTIPPLKKVEPIKKAPVKKENKQNIGEGY